MSSTSPRIFKPPWSIRDIPAGWGPDRVPRSEDLASPQGADHIGLDGSGIGLPDNLQAALAVLASGIGGGAITLKVPFTYLSGTFTFGLLGVGKVASAVTVAVTVPFDGPATIALGTLTSPGVLAPMADNDPRETALYAQFNSFTALVSEPLLAAISAPGVTAGAGYFLVTIG